MKKILIPALAGLLTLSSCQDFLEATNLYNKDLDSFYSTPTEIDEAISGIYESMFIDASQGRGDNVSFNILDDITFAGGSSSGEESVYIDGFTDPGVDSYDVQWRTSYEGIYRANALIERLEDGVDLSLYYSDDEAEEYIAQALGESYFMRGFFFHRLGLCFGGVPLITATNTDRAIARSTYLETFSQAASDFLKAINTFPDKKATEYTTSDYGHANRWIAMGYLARAYLHATGYMTNIEGTTTTELPLTDLVGGGSLTKSDVIGYIEDCRDNSGYALLEDFRNLWPYAHVPYAAVEFGDESGVDRLPWARDNNLVWAGQDGFAAGVIAGTTGNSEVMFSRRYGQSYWESGAGETITNAACIYYGSRDNFQLSPFGGGWGWAPVNPTFHAEWSTDDLRRDGSILAMNDAANNTESFVDPGFMHNTNLVIKKYAPVVITGAEYGIGGIFEYIYQTGSYTDYQTWSGQDFILLRFADIYLMHSELTETAAGMNVVRNRAQLDDVEWSLDNLKKERLYEFAYEGIRWFDIVRWGDILGSSTYFGRNATVYNSGVSTTYNQSYPTEQKGLLPIPESEITLSNGVYTQNPGWEY